MSLMIEVLMGKKSGFRRDGGKVFELWLRGKGGGTLADRLYQHAGSKQKIATGVIVAV